MEFPMFPRSLRHRAPLLWVLLPMMAGIVVGNGLSRQLRPGWLILAGAAALGCAWRFRIRAKIWGTA
ncbi:MAG TPA: hypothetical protein VIM69_01760, partial [Opitutaceae bacterium]